MSDEELQVTFHGGPWDGVEMKAPFLPDVITFRNLDVAIEGGQRSFEVSTSIRSHWVYLLELESESARHYRYAPGEQAWWESAEK